MVSKSSSILMAIGIVAVAAVAIIGLGYAYTASTQNAGNEVASSYLLVTQTSYSDGFEDYNVVFSTSNPDGTAQNTVFTLDGTVSASTGAESTEIVLKNAVETGGYYAKKGQSDAAGDKIYILGDSTFTITRYNMDTIPTYKFKVAATGLDTTHYKYYIALDNVENYYAFTGSDLTINGMTGGTGPLNVNVKLYIAAGGTPPTSTDKPLTNAAFTITADVS